MKNEFFHHNDWSDCILDDFVSTLDSYMRYYKRLKEPLGQFSQMQFRKT